MTRVNLVEKLNDIFKGNKILSVDGMNINKDVEEVKIIKEGEFPGIAFKFSGEKVWTIFPLDQFTNFNFEIEYNSYTL